MKNDKEKVHIVQVITLFIFCCIIIISCRDSQKINAASDEPLNPSDSVKVALLRSKTDEAMMNFDYDATRKAFEDIIFFYKQRKMNIGLFTTYYVYGQRLYLFDKIKMGENYIDSAVALAYELNLPKLRPIANMALATKPKNVESDSAIYYYEKAMKDTAFLTSDRKSMLFSNMASTYMSKGYYKEAKQYTENAILHYKNDGTKIDLINSAIDYEYLYACNIGLKDTAAAFKAILTAYNIVMDSLDGNGESTIFLRMGDYYYYKNMPDSALFHYNEYDASVKALKQENAIVLPYIMKAMVYEKMGDFENAKQLLGEASILGNPADSTFPLNFRYRYYQTLYSVAKHYKNDAEALVAMEKISNLNDKRFNEENQTVLTQFEEKLTRARAENTIKEKERKIEQQQKKMILYASIAIALGCMGLLLIVNQKRKRAMHAQKISAMEQTLIFERTRLRLQAEDEERKRISKEIHDDIGPSVTILNMAANIFNTENVKKEDLLRASDIIRSKTTIIAGQLEEIIWSLNSSNDTLSHFAGYTRNFAITFLEDLGSKLIFENNVNDNVHVIEGYKRRILLHTIKEIIHNAVKYSGSDTVSINMTIKESDLIIEIVDYGTGLEDELLKNTFRNGFDNIKTNMNLIQGKVEWLNLNGLTVILTMQLSKLS